MVCPCAAHTAAHGAPEPCRPVRNPVPAMAHLLVVAAIVLAAWTVLALPLGVLVGRRLRRSKVRRRLPRRAAGRGADGSRGREPPGLTSRYRGA